jgi:hypothetical protein
MALTKFFDVVEYLLLPYFQLGFKLSQGVAVLLNQLEQFCFTALHELHVSWIRCHQTSFG